LPVSHDDEHELIEDTTECYDAVEASGKRIAEEIAREAREKGRRRKFG
jgi:hypothetical protein